MNEEAELSSGEISRTSRIWTVLALSGALLGTGAVYLSYLNVVRSRPATSAFAVLAGAGLIISFCLLTASLIMSIKIAVNSPRRRFWPIVTIAISGTGFIALIGISLLGTMM